MRQDQTVLMMARVAIVAQKNYIFGFIRAACALRHNVVIFKAAMICFDGLRRAVANTTT